MTTRTLTTANFWKVIEDEFEQIDGVLDGHHVETKEEALAGTLRFENNERNYKGNPGTFIRFRDIDPDYNSLNHFLQRGKQLLPIVGAQIADQKMTKDFILNWGLISECKGFVEAYILDDSDGVSHLVGAKRSSDKRSRQLQRAWVARLLARELHDEISRSIAEKRVLKTVNRFIVDPPDGFNSEWFATIIENGELKATYCQKKLSNKEAKRLAAEPAEGLPEINPHPNRLGGTQGR